VFEERPCLTGARVCIEAVNSGILWVNPGLAYDGLGIFFVELVSRLDVLLVHLGARIRLKAVCHAVIKRMVTG
jgi:hypothetical protein